MAEFQKNKLGLFKPWKENDNCSYTNSTSRCEAECGKQDFIMLKYAFSYNGGIKTVLTVLMTIYHPLALNEIEKRKR